MVSQRLVTGLLYSFSWQLNTNNSVDDGLGFIVFAQGGVQDMTGVINDHACTWRDNGTAVQSVHVLHPFAIIRCNWDSS